MILRLLAIVVVFSWGPKFAGADGVFQLDDDGLGNLSVMEGERLVLTYHYGTQLPPAGVSIDRARSSYISPVMGLDGEQLTDDFPTDHWHHRALFWAWPKFRVAGKIHDHWHLDGAWTRFERFIAQQADADRAYLSIQNAWYVGTHKVGSEILDLTVWPSGDVGQAIDISTRWTAYVPVSIKGADGAGYGGFSLRLADRKESVIAFPEGPQPRSDMKISQWGDISGRFGGREEFSGISIFVCERNPNFPPGWTVRPANDYGFLGASWPGVEWYHFKPDTPVVSRHRVWIHRGDVESGKVVDAYDAFRNDLILKKQR